MKYLLVMFFMVVANALGLQSEVDAVSRASVTGDAQAINHALLALNFAIRKAEPIDSPIAQPSPARVDAQQKIASALLQIKDKLISLAVSPDLNVSGTAIVVLSHIPNDKDVQSVLVKSLSETNSADIASKSLSALFQTGMADQTVGEIAAKRIAEFDLHDNSGQSVALSLLQSAKNNPIPAALDTYLNILRSDDRRSAKLLAVNAIVAVGTDAGKYLSEIRKLLERFEREGADFREINALRDAVRSIEGAVARQAHSGAVKVDASEAMQSATNFNQQSVVETESSLQPIDERSNPSSRLLPKAVVGNAVSWSAIVGGFVFVIAAGVYLFRFTRKSRK